MKKLILCAGCALVLAGCGEAKKEESANAKAPAQEAAAPVLKNSDLVKQTIDSLNLVSAKEIALEQKGLAESAAALSVLDNLAQLEALTGLKFYGSSAKINELSPKAKALLTAKNPKFMPFYTEDLTTGTVYFAPADAQATIIAQWRRWFAIAGKTLDAPATLKTPATGTASAAADANVTF